MRYVLAFVALLAIILIACEQQAPVCSTPYILQGGKCCLDANNDSACDTRAAQPGQLDCSLCPPQFVTQKQEVIVYRYVCVNQTVVEKPEECGAASNARLFTPNEEQDAEYIGDFSMRPACRGKFPTAEIYLEYEKAPLNITLQYLDDPQGEYKDFGSLPVKPEVYTYLGFCLDCQNLVDYRLAPDQAYVVRAAMHYEQFTLYTRELLIDPTATGAIGRKICS